MNATNTATSVAPAAEHDSLGLVHALHTSFNRIVTIGAAPHLLRLLASQIHFTLAVCQHEEVALRNLLTRPILPKFFDWIGNLRRIHSTLRVRPAIASNVVRDIWPIEGW